MGETVSSLQSNRGKQLWYVNVSLSVIHIITITNMYLDKDPTFK